MQPITPPTTARGVPVEDEDALSSYGDVLEDEDVLSSYGDVLEDAGALCVESVPLEATVISEAFVAYVR